MNNWKQILEENGWVAIQRGGKRNIGLRSIVSSFSPKRLRYSFVSSRNQKSARQNTLSAKYGLEEIPLHTDGVLNDVPPKIVILMGPKSRLTKTLVFDLSKENKSDNFLRSAVFQFGDRRKSFNSTIYNQSRHTNFIRFNEQLMAPVNSLAADLSLRLSEWKSIASEIDWFETKILILNNHRVIHGRRPVIKDCCKYIRRLTIWPNDLDR